MDAIQTYAAAFLSSAFVAVLSAFLAARFAVSRFQSERWWALKVETYSTVLKHLSQLHYLTSRYIADADDSRPLSEGARAEIGKRVRESREHIEGAAAVGSFVMSDKAADGLSRLASSFYVDEEDYYEQLEHDQAAVKECMVVVKEEARRDLRVSSGKDGSLFHRGWPGLRAKRRRSSRHSG